MTEHTASLVPETQKAAGQFHPFAWRLHSIVPVMTLPANWLGGFKQKEQKSNCFSLGTLQDETSFLHFIGLNAN